MDKKFFKNMLVLAFPIALQQLLVSCAHLVDAAMVADLGNVEVSAVGVASRWFFLANLFFIGISSGASTMISQFWGAKDNDKIKKIYALALVFGAAAGIALNLAAFLFPENLIRVFTKESAVVDAAAQYMKIAAFASVFSSFNQISCAVLRATERVNPPLITSFIAVALNTFLNYVLIYGKFGAPAMGVRGAALATFISAVVQSASLFAVMRTSKEIFSGPARDFLKFNDALFRRFLIVCLPVVTHEVAWAAGVNLCAMVFARQGSENYAGYTIFGSVEETYFVFLVGLCGACAITTGKAIGERNEEAAYKIAKKFVVATPAIGAVVGIVLFFTRTSLLKLIHIETKGAFDVASAILAFYCFWAPIRSLPYVLIIGVFRAGGDLKTGLVYDCLSLFLIAVPVVAYLGLVIKIETPLLVAAMYFCEDVPKTILSLLRFKSRKWIRNLTS